jgi:hypothetical protein
MDADRPSVPRPGCPRPGLGCPGWVASPGTGLSRTTGVRPSNTLIFSTLTLPSPRACATPSDPA